MFDHENIVRQRHGTSDNFLAPCNAIPTQADVILKAQYHLLRDVILRLRNNIIIMYFDRYLSCFGIKFKLF